jgi:16S rRNA (adenine1518-N6/adenine1519-N6)-dimethyltransferase
MKLAEMKQWLRGQNVQLTKSLGQNFLHDENQLRRIVAAAELSAGDKVLEVGPGMGPLTELLLEAAGEVLAIEMDARLVGYLQGRFQGRANFRLLHEDGLAYAREHRDWAGWKLVANLPYSVASPLLVELAEATHPPERMTVTLQLEVAQRICEEPGSKQYGVLTLLLGLRYESRGMFKIPASCFFPEPDVDSACITLTRRAEPLLPSGREFSFTRIVKRGFSQRRKMMFKLLKCEWPEKKLEESFEKVGLSRQIRAERVSLPEFVQLTNLLSEKP